MICPKCGNEMPENAKFCSECGAKAELPEEVKEMETPVSVETEEPVNENMQEPYEEQKRSIMDNPAVQTVLQKVTEFAKSRPFLTLFIVLCLFTMLKNALFCSHKWQEATCTEPKICLKCGKTEGEAKGHTYSAATCTDPEICADCGDRQGKALGHKMTEATCEKAPKCTVCGQIEGELLGHDIPDYTVIKEATCGTEGLQEGVCTRCGKKSSQSIPATGEHTVEMTVTKQATCQETGKKEGTCSVCGKTFEETLDKIDHKDDDNWVTEKEATATADGKRATHCTMCGKAMRTETIALSMEQKNAIGKAKSYLSFMSFSRSGLIDQLEFEGYSYDASAFAVDYINPDWYEQAVKKGKSYLDFMSFSRSGLIDQLEFEGFTYDQAVYAVDALGY